MNKPRAADDEAFRQFLRRVWQHDVAPLLRGAQAQRRLRAARVGGKIAAVTGLAVDSLLHLRGRPFTRFMTVMGSRLGAMLPDVWDWQWFRTSDPAAQRLTEKHVRKAAGILPEDDALALFGLSRAAGVDDLKRSWRSMSQRWHPDKAPDAAARSEYHLRFVTYQAAYERLCEAYREGRLPMRRRAE